jgi:hypothetical protein
MRKTKSKSRKTPWDPRAIELHPSGSQQAVEARPYDQLNGGIYLQGLYVFDPRVCTSQDMRHFFWAGLRLLDSEVKSLGLSAEEVRQLMLTSFDTFHDAASGLWDTVRQMIAKGGEILPMASAVEARCHVFPAVDCSESGRTEYPVAWPALPAPKPETQDVVTTAGGCAPLAAGKAPSDTEIAEQSGLRAPANAPEGVEKTLETGDYPVADFYHPAGFGWTPEGYEVRAALKQYSESTHADR